MFDDALEIVGSSAGTLVGRLAGVSFLMLATALALHVGKLGARARAWHNIARVAYPEEGLRYRHSLGAYLCGVGLNAVAPARPGELLKLALVKRKAPGTRYRGLAATLLTESIFDTLTGTAVLAFGFAIGWRSFGGSLTSSFAPVPGGGWLAGCVALAVAAVVWFTRRHLGGTLRRLLVEVRRGCRILGDPKRYLRAVVSWQLAALSLRLASIYCFLAAFNLSASFQAALLVLAVQSVANLIPLTPNGAGTQQALLVFVLGGGATASSIVGFGAGTQLATAAGEVVLALLSLVLMTGSLRWRRLVAAGSEPKRVSGAEPAGPRAVPLPGVV
jgi:uncharacterized membrane protein YbhN (UPF0104 family)